MEIVPLDQLPDGYEDMADLAKIFNHQIQKDDVGVIRWKTNRLMNLLIEGCQFYTPPGWEGPRFNITYNGGLDMNYLSGVVGERFSLEEWMKFYMGIGYSLGGYGEVFGQREITAYGIGYFEEPPADHDFNSEYWETPIEYMRKKYKGQVLSI